MKTLKTIGIGFFVSFAIARNTHAAQIVFDGTSLMSGYVLGYSNSMPAQLMKTLPTNYTALNLSLSGQKGFQMLTNFDAKIAPHAADSDAIVFDMGTNDLAVEGADVETVKARYAEYRQRCFDAGYKWVFIRPLSPRSGDTLTFTETNRLAINAWLVESFPTNVVNPASEPRIYGPWPGYTRYWVDDLGNHWGNEWFLDSVHLNLTGLPIDAAALRRKMVEVGFLKFDAPAVAVNFVPSVAVSGAVGNSYRIEFSDALNGWQPLAEIILTNSTQLWFDSSGAKDRFYRAVEK